MELLKIESIRTGEKFYFTGLQQCADFLDVSYNTIRMWNNGVTKTCRGFKSIEWIDSNYVISGKINLPYNRNPENDLTVCNELEVTEGYQDSLTNMNYTEMLDLAISIIQMEKLEHIKSLIEDEYVKKPTILEPIKSIIRIEKSNK
jgi:hypothetical protein